MVSSNLTNSLIKSTSIYKSLKFEADISFKISFIGIPVINIFGVVIKGSLYFYKYCLKTHAVSCGVYSSIWV